MATNINHSVKLLVVSPYYTPFAGVGANRMTSLTNYLSIDNSIEVTVVRNDIRSYKNSITKDHSRSNISIHEVSPRDSFLRNAMLYKKEINKLLRTNTFDCILISVGPFYTLPLVQFIQNKFNIPVILDIRDYWANEPLSKDFEQGILYKVKNIIKDWFFQKRAIKKAKVIVTMSEEDKSYLKQTYKTISFININAIYNGFDDTLIDENKNYISDFQFKGKVVSVFGKFSEYMNYERLNSFCNALRIAKNDLGSICFLQIGRSEKILSDLLEKNGIDYMSTGYMDYSKGLNLLKHTSDVNLLSSDLVDTGYGTKFFDYIYCNKPILFVGNSNTFLFNKVRTFKYGYSCNNESCIISVLNEIFDNNINVLDNNLDPYKFSRSYQNKKYKNLINKIINNI